MDGIEERSNQISFDLDLLKLCILPAHQKCGDFIVQIADDGFVNLVSIVCLVLCVICWENSWTIVSATSLTHCMKALGPRVFLVQSTPSFSVCRFVKISVRLHSIHFSLSSDMSDRGIYWADVNVCNLDTLVVSDLKLIGDDLWWAFYCKWFLWACTFAVNAASHCGLLLLHFALVVVLTKEVHIATSSTPWDVLIVSRVRLLKCFIDFYWWHQLSFSQEAVYLLHKLKSCILLVQNQSINIIDHDWDFSPLEEELEQLPVVFLLLVVFSVVETVHLDLRWEIPWEHFSHEETVVEGSVKYKSIISTYLLMFLTE